MRVRVHPNASTNYIRRCYRHAPPTCGRLHNPDFAAMLEAVQGQWLEVETAYLFNDQFNTAPIPGVSKNGLRLMDADIIAIEDDERPGRARCNWCGHHGPVGDPCTHCGKSGFGETFYPQTRHLESYSIRAAVAMPDADLSPSNNRYR
jgi:hypothetical protein